MNTPRLFALAPEYDAMPADKAHAARQAAWAHTAAYLRTFYIGKLRMTADTGDIARLQSKLDYLKGIRE